MEAKNYVVGGVEFKNPLLLSGGIINESLIKKAITLGAGGVTIGTYAEKPLSSHPQPWIMRVDRTNCYVNAFGVRSSVFDKREFIGEVIGLARKYNVRVICSYVATTPEVSVRIINNYERLGCDIIEFNPTPLIMGCSRQREQDIISNEQGLVELISRYIEVAVENTNLPVSIKFPGIIKDVVSAWKAFKKSGAIIAHLSNAMFPATILDATSGKPILGSPTGMGGLTGECIKPLVLAKIYTLAENGEKNIIGTGGITYPNDIKEFLLAGAKIVGFHSVIYSKGISVIKEFLEYLNPRR